MQASAHRNQERGSTQGSSSPRGQKQEGEESFKVTLGYVVSLRPTWATQDSVLKQNKMALSFPRVWLTRSYSPSYLFFPVAFLGGVQ